MWITPKLCCLSCVHTHPGTRGALTVPVWGAPGWIPRGHRWAWRCAAGGGWRRRWGGAGPPARCSPSGLGRWAENTHCQRTVSLLFTLQSLRPRGACSPVYFYGSFLWSLRSRLCVWLQAAYRQTAGHWGLNSGHFGWESNTGLFIPGGYSHFLF